MNTTAITPSDPCAANHSGPGIFPIRLHPYLRQHLWYIDGEFVRRSVLARVETFRAVVAEVREVIQIALGKLQPALHRRKHGAEAFAIAAGIADRQQTIAFTRQRDQFAASAACLPAMRPNTVPIVMPKPARYPLPRILPAISSPAAKIFRPGVPSRMTMFADLIHLDAEIGEGDSRPQRISQERRQYRWPAPNAISGAPVLPCGNHPGDCDRIAPAGPIR